MTRKHFPLSHELALALLPTATVLIVFVLVQHWSRHQLLFTSLASSAFLIYVNPRHKVNSIRTLIIAQSLAALTGYAVHTLLGSSFWTAGGAMAIVIFGMILLRAMHPPAVSTALSFALGAGTASGLTLFGVCLSLILVLVALQQLSVRLLAWGVKK